MLLVKQRAATPTREMIINIAAETDVLNKPLESLHQEQVSKKIK